jgi:hypothetical protein
MSAHPAKTPREPDMNIIKRIFVPAILALGAAGAIASSVAVPASAAAAPASHSHTVAMAPSTWYHT